MIRPPTSRRARWACLRLQIIGPLLAAPPKSGELRERLEELARGNYLHPVTSAPTRFGASTLERWYYQARNAGDDPMSALERRGRSDAGQQPSLGAGLRRAIELQYREHPRWSYQLHHDNLVALAALDPEVGTVPSYTTVRRYMKRNGLLKLRKKKRVRGEHLDASAPSVPNVPREMRSFEVEHVHGLWHSDFHEGSRKVLLPSGEWKTPVLLGVLDDYSRLACHLQWYLSESSETFAHGLSQALQKRGLCRSLITDNGKALTATELEEGLTRLGIVHWTTLPYTPEQNAKIESFWTQVEGRLLPMLENYAELTLELLNRATSAWVELEYNRARHDEIGVSPLERFQSGTSVGRNAPSSEELRRVFRREEQRTQRRSDGTLSVQGVRFEIPSRYRTLLRPTVRYAQWDLSTVDLVDSRTGRWLCGLLPLDRQQNADGRRSAIEPVYEPSGVEPAAVEDTAPRSSIAPLLRKLMADYAATGLPPAYVPHATELEKPE
jgi:putative transposase